MFFCWQFGDRGMAKNWGRWKSRSINVVEDASNQWIRTRVHKLALFVPLYPASSKNSPGPMFLPRLLSWRIDSALGLLWLDLRHFCHSGRRPQRWTWSLSLRSSSEPGTAYSPWPCICLYLWCRPQTKTKWATMPLVIWGDAILSILLNPEGLATIRSANSP